MKVMKEQGFGPVLFREECIFKREIIMSDVITLTAKILKMRPHASRWTILHELIKADGTLCAQITVEGAWMDVVKRRLANPTPQIAIDVLNTFPKAPDFEYI